MIETRIASSLFVSAVYGHPTSKDTVADEASSQPGSVSLQFASLRVSSVQRSLLSTREGHRVDVTAADYLASASV